MRCHSMRIICAEASARPLNSLCERRSGPFVHRPVRRIGHPTWAGVGASVWGWVVDTGAHGDAETSVRASVSVAVA